MSDRGSLEQLVSQGEGETLELRTAIPNPEHLARLIAGFANASGGVILLGVREDGSISGVLASEAEKAFAAALEQMTPRADCSIAPYVTLDMRTVMRIDVAAEPSGPIAVADGIFRRSGARLEPLPSQQIRHRIISAGSTDLQALLVPLTGTLETLTAKVLDLERALIEARSWKSRLPDVLLGAGLSALLGLALALIFFR